MSKHKILKAVAILQALLLTTILMGGCNNGGTVSPSLSTSYQGDKVREPITIKVFADALGLTTSVETSVGKVIQEKFNIVFEYIATPADYETTCNVYLASRDYPEVFRLPNLDLYQKYIDAGALISLEDYLGDMPNFTEQRADQIPFWRSHSKDGKLYKWESASPQSPAAFMDDFDAIVRTDVLQAQNWPETIYTSDYIKFVTQGLKDFPKTDNLNTVGMTFAGAESWGAMMPFQMYEKGDAYSELNAVLVVNMKEQKYDYMYELDETKESVKFFNEMYRANLLDKECFTLTDGDCLAKMTNGQALIYFYGRWNTTSANDGLVKNKTPERQYIELPIRLDSQKGQKRQFVQSLVRTIENLVITTNMVNPERFIELLDWWQTDEAQILYGTGVKGVDYEILGGKRSPLEPLKSYLEGNNPDWPMKTGVMESFLFSGFLGGRYDNSPSDDQPYRITKDPNIIAQYGLSERQKEAYKALGWTNHKSWYYDNGVFYYDGILKGGVAIDPDSDEAANVVNIHDVAVKYVSQLVFAKNDAEFEKLYSGMLAEMETFKPQKVVDAYNKALEEVLAKVK